MEKTESRIYAIIGSFAAIFACIAAWLVVPQFQGLFQVSDELTPTPASASSSSPTSIGPKDANWQGEYFDNNNFEEPALFTRDDPAPDFNWGSEGPAPGIPVDNFSVRWKRCLDFEERYYTFSARGDDYVEVWVDDLLVLTAGNTSVESQFAVSAGGHCITVRYKESDGDANVAVDFKAGEPFPTVDSSIAWQGEYFKTNNFEQPPTYTRNDPAPLFDWKRGNPAPGIPVDNFSVRWTRCLDFEGRDYLFSARGDDKVEVLVDGSQVLTAGSSALERQFVMSAGRHCITVMFREFGGDAYISFNMRGN